MSVAHMAPREAKDAPLKTSLDAVRHLPTVPVFSQTEPNMAGLLGLTRWHAYHAVKRGELPSVRVGRRVLVPVVPLRRLLGDLPAETPPEAASPVR